MQHGSKHDIPDRRDVIRMYGLGEIPSDTKHDLVKYISHVYKQGELDRC